MESSRAEECYIWMEVKPVVTYPKGNFPLFSFWNPNLNSSVPGLQVDLISDEFGGNSQLKSNGSMGTRDPQTGWPLYLAKVIRPSIHSIFVEALVAPCSLVRKRLRSLFYPSKSRGPIFSSPTHLVLRSADFWKLWSLL